MSQKIYKYYGIYQISNINGAFCEHFVDVISEKDVGLAARWTINKGYVDKSYILHEISIKRLKEIKRILKQQKSEIATRIANISRYV